MRRNSTILLIGALAISLVAAGLLWRASDRVRFGDVPSASSGSVGGPFVLTDQDGRRRSEEDFRGRWVLLYFGYTNCPDVCPTTLALMANVLGKLGPNANLVVPVFVTIDPARDTPSILKTYLAAFGPRFVGLTGSPASIAEIARDYRVYYAMHPLPGSGYAMDHSSVVYLLDPKGKFVKAYNDEAHADAIAADLEKLF